MPNIILLSWVSAFFAGQAGYSGNKEIPIYFSEYGVTIPAVAKLGDTIYFNRSSKEEFKFVFYDRRGKCYCERYIEGKLYEKGYYANSLDTLKTYTSERFSDGHTTPLTVYSYFEPLRDGEWTIYADNKQTKEKYQMGVLQKAN